MKAIFFDVLHTYYMPQYAPVIARLQERGVECHAMLHRGDDDEIKQKAAEDSKLNIYWAKSNQDAAALYNQLKPSWVVFGNGFESLDALSSKIKTALLFHGLSTSVKSATLSSSLNGFHVRFVEHSSRLKLLQETYPDTDMHAVGFAKLDPLRSENQFKEKFDLHSFGLDPNRKTLLYAPTFYPSSIENIPLSFPSDFSDYNILIKAHDFTLNKAKYSKQRARLQAWDKYENVYLAKPEQYSLLPFMATSDLLISDTSSAIFEFASLDKPVIICDFPKLRWNYRGLFKYRLNRRLDQTTLHYQSLAHKAKTYAFMKDLVLKNINTPNIKHNERARISKEIMGNMDGQASSRIVDILLQEQ